jgi:hypothetical protein
MSIMVTPPWFAPVEALLPGGAGQAGRVGAGQVTLSVISSEEPLSEYKCSTPSVSGVFCLAGSAARACEAATGFDG